jgi:hypothetical protein
MAITLPFYDIIKEIQKLRTENPKGYYESFVQGARMCVGFGLVLVVL